MRACRLCQASKAATMHPEQRLIPLDCACSFGSVIPLSAVQSKRPLVSLGPMKTSVFHSAALLPVCLGNSAPIWLVGCAAGHTSFRLRTLVAVELW